MCRRYTTYRTVVILQLVKLGYMIRLLPGHYQVNKEIVLRYIHSLYQWDPIGQASECTLTLLLVLIKVHSLDLPMGSHW